MDRILFGDNQFLGVNHQDPEKATRDLQRFSAADEILTVLGHAYEAGIRSFVFTHHPRFDVPMQEIRRSNLYPDLKLYPCLPYAHKYNDLLASRSAASVFLGELRKVRMRRLLSGIRAAATADIWAIIATIISAEIDSAGLPRLDGIFLQNVATDLALGLDQDRGLAKLSERLRASMAAELGFITMNHQRTADRLRAAGVPGPIVCSNINAAGYRMNPSKDIVEDAINRNTGINIAMSVMASGIIDPESAVEYISGLENVHSVLFGSSRRDHIESFIRLLHAADSARNRDQAHTDQHASRGSDRVTEST